MTIPVGSRYGAGTHAPILQTFRVVSRINADGTSETVSTERVGTGRTGVQENKGSSDMLMRAYGKAYLDLLSVTAGGRGVRVATGVARQVAPRIAGSPTAMQAALGFGLGFGEGFNGGSPGGALLTPKPFGGKVVQASQYAGRAAGQLAGAATRGGIELARKVLSD